MYIFGVLIFFSRFSEASDASETSETSVVSSDYATDDFRRRKKLGASRKLSLFFSSSNCKFFNYFLNCSYNRIMFP